MASKILTKIKQRPFLAGGVATASLLFLSRRRRDRLPDGEIWLDMDLSQPLAKAPPGVDLSFLSGEPPPLYVRDVVDALEMAANDSKVRGVLGRFSYRSWGMGTLACVQEVRDAVTAFRGSGPSPPAAADADDAKDGGGQQRRPKKFTIAVADTFGEGGPAVGEYFLASAFEKILVQKSGYVGLTGAGAQGLFFRGFLDKYGIKPELFAREEYKNAADSIVSKAYSKHNREATTSLLTSILDNVADGIAASRGFGGRKDVIAIMQDCPLPAKAALSANLIDGIMYENDVASLVKNGFVAKPAGAESDAAGESAAAAKEHALSTFADPGGDGEGGEGKCTRVSMRDYIKKMKEERAQRGRRGMLDPDMLPDAAKGAAAPAAKTVALINVTGAITRFDGAGPRSGEGATSSTLCKRLEQLVDDKTVGAVVIRVDSPGGSAVASDSIAAAVRRVKAAGKPVVCSMGDVAASGGYMIAAACDAIVAQPTTITGSIGVIAAKLSVERLLKDWGIAVDSIELTENHLSFSALKAFTPKQRSLLDKRIGEIYADFVGDVAAGRKLPIEEVYKSAKGRVWTGQQALDRGLVDELGGLNKAIAIAKTKAGLPEEALVVGAKRKSLAQVATQMLSRGNGTGSSSIETGGDGGGVRTLALALADSVVGAEAMDAVFSAVSVLASVNDLAKGKMPGGRAARGELELDVDDL